jgi:hypothetical protein
MAAWSILPIPAPLRSLPAEALIVGVKFFVRGELVE